MACRPLLNLDDDLLCRRVPGQDIPVPCADGFQLKALFLMVQPATPPAGIRAVFARQDRAGRVTSDVEEGGDAANLKMYEIQTDARVEPPGRALGQHVGPDGSSA
jgi:hypothetical protein